MAIAASFLIVFITVPLQRLLSMIRRQVDINVPLVTDAKGYPLVADEIAATLRPPRGGGGADGTRLDGDRAVANPLPSRGPKL
jgi:hypothetical protein